MHGVSGFKGNKVVLYHMLGNQAGPRFGRGSEVFSPLIFALVSNTYYSRYNIMLHDTFQIRPPCIYGVLGTNQIQS